MKLQNTFIKATTVEAALAAAENAPGKYRFMAGGTDVIVNKFQGNIEANCLIDLTEIEALKGVSTEGTWLRIGALVKLNDLKEYPLIRNHFPTLIESANSVASPVIRKTATLGGNILCENRCTFYNQSDWWREAVGYCLKCEGNICIATGGKKGCFSKLVSDTAPLLISCDAKVELVDEDGVRDIKLEDLYSGDGIQPLTFRKPTVISSVLLPLNTHYTCVFKKLRPREGVDFSSLTTAASVSALGNIRIVVSSVDPMPILVEGDRSDKPEDLIQRAYKKCRVVDNDVYSRQYRRDMIYVFLKNSMQELKLFV